MNYVSLPSAYRFASILNYSFPPCWQFTLLTVHFVLRPLRSKAPLVSSGFVVPVEMAEAHVENNPPAVCVWTAWHLYVRFLCSRAPSYSAYLADLLQSEDKLGLD